MTTRLAMGFALLAWTTAAAAEGATESPSAPSCYAEPVSSKSECGVRWRCGESSTLVVKVDSCVVIDELLRNIRREDYNAPKFPLRASDGTTFDVFSISSATGGNHYESDEYLVVVSRGAEAKGFSDIRAWDNRVFELVETPKGAALVVRQPPRGDDGEHVTTITFDGEEYASSEPPPPVIGPHKTFRGRIESASRADGFGSNIVVPEANVRVHVDNDGACKLDRFGSRLVDVVLEPSTLADGSTRHRCVDAKAAALDACDEEHVAACVARCDNDDAKACAIVGEAAYTGNGMRSDHKSAALAYWTACEARVGRGCGGLATMFFRGDYYSRNTVVALRLNDLGCEAGWQSACDVALGLRQSLAHAAAIPKTKRGKRTLEQVLEGPPGKTTDGDECETLSDCRAKCSANQAGACTILADRYANGEDVHYDWAQAATLYARACDGGNARGCNGAGFFYAMGRGVGKDRYRAMRYFQKACEGFNDDSCKNVEAISCPIKTITAARRNPQMDAFCNPRNGRPADPGSPMPMKAYRAGDGTSSAYQLEIDGECFTPMRNYGCFLARAQSIGQTAWCCR